MMVDIEGDLMESLLIVALGKTLIQKNVLQKTDIIEQILKFSEVAPDNKAKKELDRIVVKLCDAVSKWEE